MATENTSSNSFVTITNDEEANFFLEAGLRLQNSYGLPESAFVCGATADISKLKEAWITEVWQFIGDVSIEEASNLSTQWRETNSAQKIRFSDPRDLNNCPVDELLTCNRLGLYKQIHIA